MCVDCTRSGQLIIQSAIKWQDDALLLQIPMMLWLELNVEKSTGQRNQCLSKPKSGAVQNPVRLLTQAKPQCVHPVRAPRNRFGMDYSLSEPNSSPGSPISSIQFLPKHRTMNMALLVVISKLDCFIGAGREFFTILLAGKQASKLQNHEQQIIKKNTFHFPLFQQESSVPNCLACLVVSLEKDPQAVHLSICGKPTSIAHSAWCHFLCKQSHLRDTSSGHERRTHHSSPRCAAQRHVHLSVFLLANCFIDAGKLHTLFGVLSMWVHERLQYPPINQEELPSNLLWVSVVAFFFTSQKSKFKHKTSQNMKHARSASQFRLLETSPSSGSSFSTRFLRSSTRSHA